MAEESSLAETRNEALDRPSKLYKHLVEGLPPELFFRTLEFVEAKSIISMLTGNKELHSLVDGTFEYQSSRYVDALEEIAERFSGHNNEQETRKTFSEGLPNNDPGLLRSLFGRLSDTARSIPNIPKRLEAIGMIAKTAGVLEGEQLSKEIRLLNDAVFQIEETRWRAEGIKQLAPTLSLIASSKDRIDHFQHYLASGFVEVGDGAEQTEYVSNAEIISALASEAIYLSEENGKAFFRSFFEKAITRRNVQGDLALANVIPALAAGLSVMRLPREQLTYLDHLARATERIAGHGARAKTIEKLFEKLSLIDIACRDVAYGDLRDRGFRFVERGLKAEMISAAAKQLTALPHDRRDQRRTELVAKLTEIEALDPAAIPEPIPEPEVAPAVARAGLTALAGSFEDPAAGVLFYRQYKQRACQIDSPQARSEMFPSLVQGLRFINSPIERTQEFAFLANDVLATNFFRNANPQFESVARTKAVGELLNALDVVESTTEQAQLLHKFSNHAQSIENNATKVEQIGHVARRLCAPMSDESRVEIVNTLGKALTPIVKYQRFKMEENNALQRGFEGMGAAVKAIQDNSARYEGVRQLTHLALSLKEDYSRSIAARGVRSTISVAVPEERPNLAWRLAKNVRYEVSFAFELGIGNPASMPSRRLAILQTSNVSRPGFIIER